MKDYKEIIKQLAEGTFSDVQHIEMVYRQAEEAKNKPQKDPLAAARAELDYKTAREAYLSMKRNLPGKVENQLRQLRREYAAELEGKYTVDPEKLNMQELELLKSGIMRPDEYKAMLEKEAAAGNSTMARLIAKYAAKEAEAVAQKNGESDEAARALRAVSYTAKADPAAEALRNFDDVADVLSRCVNNTAMIQHWDGLAGPLLDMI